MKNRCGRLDRRAIGAAAILALACGASGVCAVAAKTTAKQITVQANGDWVDTGIDVGAEAKLKVTAEGSIQYPDAAQAAGPEGLSRGWKDLLRVMPLNSAGRGALIGRIGNDDVSQAFLIGASKEFSAGRAGRLYLSVNQMGGDSGDGSFKATVVVEEPGKAAGPPVAIDKLPVTPSFEGITAETLDTIPRRVSDNEGHLGDMVNFLILGPEKEMRQTFTAAGWVQVDKTTKDAILHGLVATLSKEEYTAMPMSELYLFGRAQDFGMAHAEPFQVVASRNHLRLWKAPFQVNGQTLWVGAATHDIGFEKDDRNGGVTHKIDPDIDKERAYVGESLSATGLVERIAFMMPRNPVKDSKTATGGGFRTDGRILVMALSGR